MSIDMVHIHDALPRSLQRTDEELPRLVAEVVTISMYKWPKRQLLDQFQLKKQTMSTVQNIFVQKEL